MKTGKSTLGLKETINLAKKIDIIKTEKNIEETDKTIQKIHSLNSSNKRITIDFPDELYTEMKMKTFKSRITLREYILTLVQKDVFV
jgi:hypothetical protein